MTEVNQKAQEKIREEFKAFAGDGKAMAVSSYVCNVLQDFCGQDDRFAAVVLQFKRTLSDCCAEIMKGVGTSISDIDVYRNAVKFYFPNSEIAMTMTIDITGTPPDESEIQKEAPPPKKPKKKKKTGTKSTAEHDEIDDELDEIDDHADIADTEHHTPEATPMAAPKKTAMPSKKATQASKSPQDIIQLSLF